MAFFVPFLPSVAFFYKLSWSQLFSGQAKISARLKFLDLYCKLYIFSSSYNAEGYVEEHFSENYEHDGAFSCSFALNTCCYFTLNTLKTAPCTSHLLLPPPHHHPMGSREEKD